MRIAASGRVALPGAALDAVTETGVPVPLQIACVEYAPKTSDLAASTTRMRGNAARWRLST